MLIVVGQHVFCEWMPKYLYTLHICELLLLPPSLNIISQLNEKLDIYCGFYIFYNMCNLYGAQTCIPLLDNKVYTKQPHSQNSDLESIYPVFTVISLAPAICHHPLASVAGSAVVYGSVIRRHLIYSTFFFLPKWYVCMCDNSVSKCGCSAGKSTTEG